jgi:alpha-tubulin suppressor-like RCC1 family protein
MFYRIAHFQTERRAAVAIGIALTGLLLGGPPAVAQDVTAWGYAGYGQLAVPAGLRATQVSAGVFHTLALREDGTVAAWGSAGDGSGSGNFVIPTGLAGVVQVAAGDYHSLALREDGTVVAWGSNGFGQTTVPVGLTGVVQVAGGVYHTVALRGDGSVAAWGHLAGVPFE